MESDFDRKNSMAFKYGRTFTKCKKKKDKELPKIENNSFVFHFSFFLECIFISKLFVNVKF